MRALPVASLCLFLSLSSYGERQDIHSTGNTSTSPEDQYREDKRQRAAGKVRLEVEERNIPKIESHDQFIKDVLEAPNPVLVEIYALGCLHCQSFAPKMKKIAKELQKAKISTVRVDGAKHPDMLKSHYHIKGFPTLLLFYNGSIIGYHEGALPQTADVIASQIIKIEKEAKKPSPPTDIAFSDSPKHLSLPKTDTFSS